MLLQHGMTFVEHVPIALGRVVGLAEVAGAFGLILPAALRIKPQLTPIAAAALAFVMVLAVLTHVVLGEFAALGGPIMLASLAGFVAWGRSKNQAIAPRELVGARA